MAKRPDTEHDAAPWERQPKESAEAFQAFIAYRDMEGRRSTRTVAQKLLKSDNIVRRWSSVHGWPLRALQWDDEVDRINRDKFLEKVAKSAEEHATVGRGIWNKAVKKLTLVKGEKLSTRQAMAFAMMGIKVEREALELDRARRDRQTTIRAQERAILRDEIMRGAQGKGTPGTSSDPSKRPWRVTLVGAEGEDPIEVMRDAVNMYFDKPHMDAEDEPLIPPPTQSENDDDDY